MTTGARREALALKLAARAAVECALKVPAKAKNARGPGAKSRRSSLSQLQAAESVVENRFSLYVL